MNRIIAIVIPLLLVCITSSCSYYSRKSGKVNSYIQDGNTPEAYKILTTKPEKWERRKDALLYYLMRGEVAWMLGKYDESIEYLKKADYHIEDEKKKLGDYTATIVLNEKASLYVGNEYEAVLVHYYQILNYISTNQLEKAEVQGRRLVLALQVLDDSRLDTKAIGSKKSNKFQRSAFGHTLLGFVYELRGNYNSAFISYRNALKIYEEDYTDFKVDVPLQLKKDIIRTAYLTGFYEESESYQKRFNLPFNAATDANAGNVILLWNNGMIPEKYEESINFTLVKNISTGYVTFINNDYGYSFSTYVGSSMLKDSSGLASVSFVRVAFPRLLDKKPVVTGLAVNSNGINYNFEKLEDLQAISHKIMQDNSMEELGKIVLRLALKKGSEYALRKSSPAAGMVLSGFNAISERADTRSWNTLPRDIFYTRITLPEGDNTIQLSIYSNNNKIGQDSLKFNIKNNNIYIHAYQTLKSYR